ncbi:MAG: sulfite oxidase-like oxidoreductase [Rhodospirillales bacterium]|nr:sulfite oxidase-like oxidoreductase [Rhodospirillales bacterium]
MAEDDPTSINEKLVAAKRQWAREGRLLTGEAAGPGRDRLPPGQRRVDDWPVLDLGLQPDIALTDWSLAITGLVEAPVRWNWGEFMAQPQVTLRSDIHCVTAWSRYDNEWQGLSARQVLAVVRPKPEARFVLLRSYDGYTTNLALSHFDDEDVLLAHRWQGHPIGREHGGPVRMVVPRLYFWKSAKWIRAIAFSDTDQPGYWEVRGYHNEADPWQEERYG